MIKTSLYWILCCTLVIAFACKKDEDVEPIALKVTPDFLVFSSKAGDIVQFTVSASSGVPLKKFYITSKMGSSFTQTLKDSTLPGSKNFKYNYEYEMPSNTSDYSVILNFLVIDETGEEKSTARQIDVTL